MNVIIIPTTPAHCEEIMSWFSSKETFFTWSGPNFRFPYTLATFSEDLRFDELASFSLVDDAKKLIAFGQYYPRLNKCHLARLVVEPSLRGKGIVHKLMQLLLEKGELELRTDTSSLFVLTNNLKAIKSYQKFGFKIAPYPDLIPIPNCLYMTRG